MGHRPRPRRDDPRAQRRCRDHPHRDRDDDPRARAPARPAARAPRTPGAAVDDCGRGVHPLGHAGAEHAPDRDRRPRAAWPGAARGRRAAVALRSGEPRPARVRRARRPRRGASRAARGIRLRDALLPRRARGAARDPRHVRGAAATDPRLGARRSRRTRDPAGHVRPCVRRHPDPLHPHPRARRTMTVNDATQDELVVEERGAVRLLVLNRPDALNAANEPLHGALSRVWHELAEDDGIRAVVITGAGRAFCGGGDLNLLERMTEDVALRTAIMDEAAAIVRGMTALSVPIIAAVNGPAVGLGGSLASMSDIVLIEEHAYFSDPHVMLGLVAADGGGLMWPLLTGLLRAKEYIPLGDRLPAEEAVRIGIANRVVPKGSSVDAALELADRIAGLPPQAVRDTKRLLNQTVKDAVDAVLTSALADETASFDEPAFRANLSRMLGKSASGDA